MLTARLVNCMGPTECTPRMTDLSSTPGARVSSVQYGCGTAALQRISWRNKMVNRPHAVVITLRAPGLERIEAQWRKEPRSLHPVKTGITRRCELLRQCDF